MCCTTSAGQGFASRPLGNQRLDLRALQAIEHEGRDVGAWRPGRAELRAIRQHVQHRHRGRLLDHQPEHLQRGGVGPVQVFPRRQHRLPLGLRRQPCDQRVQRLLFLLLRRHRQRRIALRRQRHRQQPGEQRHHLGQRQARGPQPRLQFGQPGRGGIVRRKLQQVLEVGDHGIEGTGGVIGRTAKGHARQALGAHLRPQPLHQGRLANTGLAADEDHLPQPGFALVPAAAQQPALLLPPHQHRHRGRHKLLVAAGRRQQATHTADRHRLGNPMERVRPQVFQGKGARAPAAPSRR